MRRVRCHVHTAPELYNTRAKWIYNTRVISSTTPIFPLWTREQHVWHFKALQQCIDRVKVRTVMSPKIVMVSQIFFFYFSPNKSLA